ALASPQAAQYSVFQESRLENVAPRQDFSQRETFSRLSSLWKGFMTPVDLSKNIKLIREPTVYVMSRQTVDDAALAKFLSDHGVTWETDTEVAGEHLVEVAGRDCYMSFAKPRPGGNKAYIDHILEVGHGSVLEHAVWNFLFTGISRTLTHELIRHRAGWGYSQLSQRYVDESVAEYVEPDCVAGDPELHKIWLDAV